jgi:predicted ArsR family transcriptional regulator
METLNLTESQLLEALREAMGAQPDQSSVTTTELMERFGLSEGTVRRRLKPLIRSGKLVATRKVVTDMAGRPQPVPAYKLAA